MTDPKADPYAAFRINLEQQQKRAKELLKAAKAGETDALRRLQRTGFTPPGTKLAQAQHCIAQELRFANWAALKQHCTSMAEAQGNLGAELDADCRTMHIRCGHDIQRALLEAGLYGDSNLHINPYLQGPVTDTPDWLERRARFITDSFAPYMQLKYNDVLADSRLEEARLHDARRNYERVALWFEHDRYDQFVLLRCLAYFAEHGAPPRLELVTTNDFPGTQRFVGLGQLPPEALKLLWEQRKAISSDQLAFARHVWDLFRSPDPRPLAALAREGTPLLPDLAVALHRHLQELPARHNGLGLTHQLVLQTLAEQGPQTVGRLVGVVMKTDPLPGLGDLGYEQVLRELANLPAPLVLRTGDHEVREWYRDEVAVTDAGQAVLAGRVNWLDLPVPERWIGGVRITASQNNWFWDEPKRAVIPPAR